MSALAKRAQGDIVADKYELREPLGAGGMGAVWSAAHTSLGYDVAIKFLRLEGDVTPEQRARFDREARVAAKLGQQSRHVARVMDHGVLADGSPYLVLERLEGVALSERLKIDAPGLGFAAELVLQLARALRVAHAAGVIHRDIKPGNVFLCPAEDGRDFFVKLLDFGVAKVQRADSDQPSAELTQEGRAVGTPAYMSPEQMRGENVDARSDLWSVAALVYRICVGRSPFGGGSEVEIGARILALEPPAPSSVNHALPAALDEWMRRGLAKRVTDRFQSIDELARALCEVANVTPDALDTPASDPSGHTGVRSAQSVAGAGEGSTSTTFDRPVDPSPTLEKEREKTRRIAYALAAAAAIAAGLALAIGVFSNRNPDATTTIASEQPAAAPPSAAIANAPAPVVANAEPVPSASPPPNATPAKATARNMRKPQTATPTSSTEAVRNKALKEWKSTEPF